MHYFIDALKKYAEFSGRTSRRGYWMFVLFNILISIAISIVEGSRYHALSNLYNLALLVPSIAIGIRRMHDTGRSGWYLIIPVYGFIITLFKGQKGSNKYGSAPKD